MYLILIIIVLILFASATIIRRAASHVSQVLREREEIRFATNSLVEGGGFEPSVPRLGWAQLPRAGQCEGVSPLQGFEPSVARKRDNGLQPQKLAPGDELGATIRKRSGISTCSPPMGRFPSLEHSSFVVPAINTIASIL